MSQSITQTGYTNSALKRIGRLPQRALYRVLRELGRRLPITSHRWGPPREKLRNTAEWCQEHTDSKFIALAEEEEATIPPPLTMEPLNEEYQRRLKRTIPARFVAIIPQGRACHNGIVLTSDDYILRDISYKVLSSHKQKTRLPVLDAIKLPPLRKITGTAAIISGPWTDNYYHWMFDVLPRLHLLQQSGLKIDNYIVDCHKVFQKQSLAFLGITPQMCIADEPDLHLQAEKLVVPSLPGGQGNPPRWVCDFIRESILKPILENRKSSSASSADKQNLPSRLYISRADAPGRRITNETELLGLLESKGFRSITLDGLSLKEQVLLFNDAQAIVTAHGAALTNLVFCRPQTRVIELFAPGWAYPIYNFVSAHCDLRLGCLFGEGERPLPANNWQYHQQDITVNIAQMETMLKRMEI